MRRCRLGKRSNSGVRGSLSGARRHTFLIATRLFRTIRAAVAVLEAGFESEAQVHDRVLLALLGHYLDIEADSTGDAAKRWIRGRPRLSDGEAVQRTGLTGKEFGRLSEPAHASARPVWRALLALEGSAGVVTWGPRRTERTRAALLSYSTMARAMARVLVDSFVISLPLLRALDQAIEDQLTAFAGDHPAGLHEIRAASRRVV